MTLAENLVKTILPEFLTYLDKLEKGEIVEKEVDINKNPSTIYFVISVFYVKSHTIKLF